MEQRDAELRAEMQEMKKEYSKEVNVIKGESKKTRTEMREHQEIITQLQMDVASTSQKLVNTTQKLSDNINRINTELRIDYKDHQRRGHQSELQEQVKRLEEEKEKILEDMAKEHEVVRRRFSEVEGRSAPRDNAPEIVKDVIFNGVDDYPMEFLQELREIKETYYQTEGRKWSGRHLKDEAMIWWRIV